MFFDESVRQDIEREFNEWSGSQYAGNGEDRRKELGQFFTPPVFSIRLLEKFKRLGGRKLFDPTCGAGGLLAAAILTGEVKPSDCYGLEIDEPTAELCRERLSRLGVPRQNIVCADVFKVKSFPDDVNVIMNPPYGKLHLRILAHLVSLLSERASWQIVSLQPYTWIEGILTEHIKGEFQTYAPVLKPYIRGIEKIKALDGTENFDTAYFFASIGIYNLSSDASDGEWDILSFVKERTSISEGMCNVLLDCHAKRAASLRSAASTSAGEFFVKLSKVHGNPNKKDFYDIITPLYKNVRINKSKSPSVLYLNFGTDEEAENCRKSLVNTAFYHFLSYLYKFDQNLKFNCYPWLGDKKHPRTGEIGYKSEWTDEDLFNFYKIPAEEGAKILKLMAKHLWATA